MNEAPDLGPDGPASTARLSYVALHRGRPVARAVAAEPIDHYHLTGSLSNSLYEAANRLRMAIRGSRPAQHITATPLYASEPGFDDAPDDRPDDDEARNACFAIWSDVKNVVGNRWRCLELVCGEHNVWAHQAGGLSLLKEGLRILAWHWGIDE